jgi:hypothetical protein
VSVLKSLITEMVSPIETKFENMKLARNHPHIMMASNEDRVVPAGIDERRVFVLNALGDRRGDFVYFEDPDYRIFRYPG